METQSFSDDLRRYLGLLWHWAWLIALATSLAGAAAYLVSKRSTPVYQASTTLLINEAPATKNADYASILTSERLARTYSELLTKNPVLEEVIEQLDLDMTSRDLRRAIQAELVRDTQLIEISIEDTDPFRAADIANTLVMVFSEQNQAMQASRYAMSKDSLSEQLSEMDEQIKSVSEEMAALGNDAEGKAERDRLEATLAQYRQTYASLLQSFEQVRVAEAASTSSVVQAEPAIASTQPVRPRTVTNTILAAVVGFMIAVGVVFLIEALDDTINPDNLSRQLSLPVLGVIAHYKLEDELPIVTSQPRSPVAEAFRSLRTNILYASVDNPVKTLLVTSPSPEDGKSTVASNLAASLAQRSQKVVLLEGDLRRPQVHNKLNIPNLSGLSDLFVHKKIPTNGILQKSEVKGLWALTSGDLPPNPAELLGSEKMVQILEQLVEYAEAVIIDTTPVLAVTDASVLASQVDGVLLVVKPGVTKLAACRQTVEQLERVGAKVLGVVINDVEISRSSYKYGYYRGYHYVHYKYYGNGREKQTIKES